MEKVKKKEREQNGTANVNLNVNSNVSWFLLVWFMVCFNLASSPYMHIMKKAYPISICIYMYGTIHT